jgi:amidase
MGGFAEYERYDGVGLATLIRNGEIKAVDVCEEAIRRAEALNPNINAIITPLYEYARKASEALPVNGRSRVFPFCLKTPTTH